MRFLQSVTANSSAMNLRKVLAEKKRILEYLIGGALIGVTYGTIEYLIRIKTGDDPQLYVPLLLRASAAGSSVMASIFIFEILFRTWFRKRRFIYLVLMRSIAYTFIITFWLTVTNGVWYLVNDGIPFFEELVNYFVDDMYVINVTSVFIVAIIITGLREINSLHGEGQLRNFVLGRYHTPREVELIFCFIDLKGSTTIAENLGHLKFAMFLRDYFSDISEAIQKTNARIYQYVGDEIILSWTYKKGLKNNNMINCFFEMEDLIESLKPRYIEKYGVYPEFRAGLHGGKAIVTWVGELKKEIVYVGDVLNTTARIQEDCKRLGKKFLISEELLNKVNDLKNIKAQFVDETTLRGKKKQVKLYSLGIAD